MARSRRRSAPKMTGKSGSAFGGLSNLGPKRSGAKARSTRPSRKVFGKDPSQFGFGNKSSSGNARVIASAVARKGKRGGVVNGVRLGAKGRTYKRDSRGRFA